MLTFSPCSSIFTHTQIIPSLCALSSGSHTKKNKNCPTGLHNLGEESGHGCILHPWWPHMVWTSLTFQQCWRPNTGTSTGCKICRTNHNEQRWVMMKSAFLSESFHFWKIKINTFEPVASWADHRQSSSTIPEVVVALPLTWTFSKGNRNLTIWGVLKWGIPKNHRFQH